MNPFVTIGNTKIGEDFPTYFIADIASNHDGDICRAKKLIALAKASGANAVKFQHFKAKNIVSDYGFKKLGAKQSHQKTWRKSVYDVYSDASLPEEWTPVLKEEADRWNIDFFSSPYDFEAIEHLQPYVSVFKIGSGDIDWDEMLIRVAKLGKPVIISSGASNIGEVQRAIQLLSKYNRQIILLQCNTNYSAAKENLNYINLNVLKVYRSLFPDLVLGLSDHTHGYVTALGSVALGGRVIEKHFTDDNSRIGPDHLFAMNPSSWKEMVDQIRRLELALGGTIKRVEANEKETVILQRRAIRAAKDILPGEHITRQCVNFLRPAANDGFAPNDFYILSNKKAKELIKAGDYIRVEHIDWN